MSSVKSIIDSLRNVKGLTDFYILDSQDTDFIKLNEDKNNLGVLEAVSRKHVIAVVHDSTWRKPAGKIVSEEKGKLVFPPVPFPEIKEKNVVSSSPGIKVHDYLKKKMNIVGNDATLLIGWD